MKPVKERDISVSSGTGLSLGSVLVVTIAGGAGLAVIVILIYVVAIAICRERRKLKRQDQDLTTIHAKNAFRLAEGYGINMVGEEQGGFPIPNPQHTPYPSLSGVEIFVSTCKDTGGRSYPVHEGHLSPVTLAKSAPTHDASQLQPNESCDRSHNTSQLRGSRLTAIMESPCSQTNSNESGRDLNDSSSPADGLESSAPIKTHYITGNITPSTALFNTNHAASNEWSAGHDYLYTREARATRATSMPAVDSKTNDQNPVHSWTVKRLHDRSVSLSGEIKQGPSHPPPALPQSLISITGPQVSHQRSSSKDSIASISSTSSSILEKGESQDSIHCTGNKSYVQASPRSSDQRCTMSHSIQGGPRPYRVRSNIVHNRLALRSTHGSLGDDSGPQTSQNLESDYHGDLGANCYQSDATRALFERIHYPPRSDSIKRFGNAEDAPNLARLDVRDSPLSDELPGLSEKVKATTVFSNTCMGTLMRPADNAFGLRSQLGLKSITEEPGCDRNPNSDCIPGLRPQTASISKGCSYGYRCSENKSINVCELPQAYTPSENNIGLGPNYFTSSDKEDLEATLELPHNSELSLSSPGRFFALPENKENLTPCSPRPRPMQLRKALKNHSESETVIQRKQTSAPVKDTESQRTRQYHFRDIGVTRSPDSPKHSLPTDESAAYQQDWYPSNVLSASPPHVDDPSTVILMNNKCGENYIADHNSPMRCLTTPITFADKDSTIYSSALSRWKGEGSGARFPLNIDIWATKPHLPPPGDLNTHIGPPATDITLLDSVKILRRLTSDSARSNVEAVQAQSEPRDSPSDSGHRSFSEQLWPTEAHASTYNVQYEHGWKAGQSKLLSHGSGKIPRYPAPIVQLHGPASGEECSTASVSQDSHIRTFDALGIQM